MTKPFRGLFFSIFLALPLYASPEPVTLNMWDVPEAWNIQGRVVFDAFVKLHPEINIVRTRGISVTGNAAESGFMMAMAAGTAPDIFEVSFRGLKLYMDQGFLCPLNEYYEKDKNLFAPFMLDKFKPIYYDRRGGDIYGVPVSFSEAFGLYYRKDLFKKAGLDPEKPPRNWDELYEYAQKLTDDSVGQYGLGLGLGIWGGWLLPNFVWQAGGEMAREYKECPLCKEINKQLDGKYDGGWAIYPDKCIKCSSDISKVDKYVWRVTFNEKPGIEALEFLKKFRYGKYTRQGKSYQGCAKVLVDYDYAMKEFLKGSVAMIFSYANGDMIAANSGFSPSEVGIATLPAGPTGIEANNMQTITWCINSQIKDKKKRDAAWEYIKFQASEEAARLRIKSIVESGQAQYANPELLKKFGYEEYCEQIPASWVRSYKRQIQNARPEPYATGYKSVATVELPLAVDKALTEEDSNIPSELDKVVEKSNKVLLGVKDPVEMNKKRAWANGIFFVLVALLIWLMIIAGKNLVGIFASDRQRNIHEGPEGLKGKHRTTALAWLFMLPALLSVAVWQYYPLLNGVRLAFLDYKIVGSSTFIWLDNFIDVFSSPLFWKSITNTLIFVSLTLGLGFFLPIIVALVLSEIPKGKVFFRTLFYTPALTTSLVLLILWMSFYDPAPTGLLNIVVGFFGIGAQKWLQDAQHPIVPMLCVIIPNIWAGAGPGSIIYLAALQGIPDDLYEAADVDGASAWQKIKFVTLPQLRPLIIINFVGAFIGAFQGMGNILVMTGGGPSHATHVLGLEIWMDAFLFLRFGYATAIAWIMGMMLIGFTIYQLRILKRVTFKVAR